MKRSTVFCVRVRAIVRVHVALARAIDWRLVAGLLRRK